MTLLTGDIALGLRAGDTALGLRTGHIGDMEHLEEGCSVGLDVGSLACGESNDESSTACPSVQADAPLHQATQLRHLQPDRPLFGNVVRLVLYLLIGRACFKGEWEKTQHSS